MGLNSAAKGSCSPWLWKCQVMAESPAEKPGCLCSKLSVAGRGAAFIQLVNMDCGSSFGYYKLCCCELSSF